MALVIDLADAIAGLLNAAEIPGLPTVRRSYPDWDDKFSDLKDVAVDVVFVSSENNMVELDGYSTQKTDVAYDVAIRKRFVSADKGSVGRVENAAVDAMLALLEQVQRVLCQARDEEISLTGGSVANWLSASVRTYCDYQRLREGIYLGVLRVRYQLHMEA
jgi:hypothetical protein